MGIIMMQGASVGGVWLWQGTGDTYIAWDDDDDDDDDDDGDGCLGGGLGFKAPYVKGEESCGRVDLTSHARSSGFALLLRRRFVFFL